MGRLSWCDSHAPLSTIDIMRKWRAFDGNIGVHAFFTPRPGQPARRVKLLQIANPGPTLPASLALLESTRPGGLAFDASGRHSGTLWLRTVDGWVELVTLQVELKPHPVSGRDFARGYGVTLSSDGPRFE